MGLTPDLVTGVWVGAEDRSVRFSTLSLGMGTNTALPIFAYYTKFINADKSLNISQEDFVAPETILKSPIDCKYNKSEIQNSNLDNQWEEDNQW
jgi:penicillin-binding protein 1A